MFFQYHLRQREADGTRPVIVGGITIEKWNPDELEEVMQKYGVLDSTVSEMSAEIEKMFPPTTDASITKAVADYTGVIDTHYSYFRFPSLIKKYPNAAVMGTESYARTSDLIKEIMDEHPEVIGDFVWTCWNHIGEAGLGRCVLVPKEEEEKYNNVFGMMDIMVKTEYPYRLSNCADFDINGVPTVQGIYRKIVWGDQSTCIAVQPPAYHDLAEIKMLGFSRTEEKQSWNFEGEEGKPIRVNVYSGAEWLELFLNEKSPGRKPAGKKAPYCASFELEYEPGILTAVSSTGRKEVSRSTIETTGKAVKIKAVPENTQAKAGVKALGGKSHKGQLGLAALVTLYAET